VVAARSSSAIYSVSQPGKQRDGGDQVCGWRILLILYNRTRDGFVLVISSLGLRRCAHPVILIQNVRDTACLPENSELSVIFGPKKKRLR
jgi:hypothetical protein